MSKTIKRIEIKYNRVDRSKGIKTDDKIKKAWIKYKIPYIVNIHSIHMYMYVVK